MHFWEYLGILFGNTWEYTCGKTWEYTFGNIWKYIFWNIWDYVYFWKSPNKIESDLSSVQNPSLIPLYWLAYRESSIG